MRRKHGIMLAAAIALPGVIATMWALARRRRRADTAGVMIRDTEIFQPSEGAIDDFERMEAAQAETPNIRP